MLALRMELAQRQHTYASNILKWHADLEAERKRLEAEEEKKLKAKDKKRKATRQERKAMMEEKRKQLSPEQSVERGWGEGHNQVEERQREQDRYF